MTNSCVGELTQFIVRERSKDIDSGEAVGDLVTGRDGTRGFAALDVQRAGGKCEGDSAAPERVPNPLPHERVGVVIFRVVVQPVLDFPIDRRITEAAYSHNRFDLV